MTKQEIELKVLEIIDKILKKQPVEDDYVELKAQWPNPRDTARRVAAHANSSRGEPILWIIGLDEKGGEVIGAQMAEVSNWHTALQSCFDEGIAPNLDKCLNIPDPNTGRTVVALVFETDRAPYVVKSESGGPITREVPWRKGNSTDSAKRSDLIKLLAPIQLSPVFEIVNGSISLRNLDHEKKKLFELRLMLYVTPRTKDLIVIPYHRCEGKIILSSELKINLDQITLFAPIRFTGGIGGGFAQDSLTVQNTHNEIVISGPGTMVLEAHAEVENLLNALSENIEAKISIKHDPESEVPAILNPSFISSKVEDSKEIARWVLKQ